MRVNWLLISLLLLASDDCDSAHSQVNAPIGDPVYRVIDKIIAHRLDDKYIYGHRPFSNKEIRRLLISGKQHLGKQKKSEAESFLASQIDYQLGRFVCKESEISGEWLKNSRISFDSGNDFRRLIESNNLGYIDARFTSFNTYEDGEKNFKGESLRTETGFTGQASKYLSGELRPFLMSAWVRDGEYDARAGLQRVYGKAAFRNFEFQAGLDTLAWGQKEHGGLIFSNHARPLPHLKLTSSAPFKHFFPLNYLGYGKWSFIVANLGLDRFRDYSWLVAWKVSLAPVHYFEIGFTQAHQFGGDGSPNINAGEAILESLSFDNASVAENGENKGNKIWAMDFRVRIPPLLKAEIYFESVFDDRRSRLFDNFGNFKDFIHDQMSFVAGAHLPALGPQGNTSVRAQFTRINALLYGHDAWRSGYTLSKLSLGDAMARDTKEILLQAHRDWSLKIDSSVDLFFRHRKADIYTQQRQKEDGIVRVVTDTNNPDEKEWGALAKASYEFRARQKIETKLGLAHVDNFGFEEGQGKWLYRLGLNYAWKF